jgi:hypothetical protein
MWLLLSYTLDLFALGSFAVLLAVGPAEALFDGGLALSIVAVCPVVALVVVLLGGGICEGPGQDGAQRFGVRPLKGHRTIWSR